MVPSSSSSETFRISGPSEDSWFMLSILSLPFLYFCCLALMRSILAKGTILLDLHLHPLWKASIKHMHTHRHIFHTAVSPTLKQKELHCSEGAGWEDQA